MTETYQLTLVPWDADATKLVRRQNTRQKAVLEDSGDLVYEVELMAAEFWL